MRDEIFDWDDEIVEESSFTLLDEGDYPFEVVKFDRSRFDGSAKIPPCNMAVVTFRVTGNEGSAEITERFMLCQKMEWKLSQFFLAIGQKRHGEPLRMNWNAVIGTTGCCKVYVDEYVKDDGTTGRSNKIKKFYAYDEKPQGLRQAPQTYQPKQSYQAYEPQQKSWKAGTF